MADLEADGVYVRELDEAPELFFDAVPFWEAFTDLSSSRQSGFGLGGIPYSEVTDWLNENDIHSMEQRLKYRWMLNATNNTFVNIKNDSGEKKKRKKIQKK